MKTPLSLLIVMTGLVFLAGEVDAVDVSVDIAPNSINTINQQLQNKVAELAEKENKIDTQQASIRKPLFIGGGIILALIFLNFYLDYRYRKNNRDAA